MSLVKKAESQFVKVVVCLKRFFLVEESEASLLKKSSCFSSNFRCDQIHNGHCHGFIQTLLCYLCQTWMFNKLTSETSSLSKNSCLAPALGVTKIITIIVVHWVTLCCPA
jgi:hypothetical protein